MRDFSQRDPSSQKSNKSQFKIDNVRRTHFLTDLKALFTSYCYSADDQFVFVGKSNGRIFYYKKRNTDNKLLVYPGKEHDQVELDSLQPHKVTSSILIVCSGRDKETYLHSDRQHECADIGISRPNH